MFNSNRWSTCVLLGALAVPTCYAYSADIEPLEGIQMSVIAMLQSETEIAVIEQVERERKATGRQSITSSSPAVHQEPRMEQLKAPDAQTEPTKPAVSTAEVMGIWGLGDRLMADVRINGQTLRFQRGSRYPQGYGAGSPYTLISILTPCVKYSEKGVARTLCIDNRNPAPTN